MNTFLDSAFQKLQSPAKSIMIGTFYAAALFSLLGSVANFDDGFFSAIGELIMMVILVALWAIVPTLLLLKKEDLAKKVFPFVLFYWLINELSNLFASAGWIKSKVSGLLVTIGIFEFFIALAFIAAIVLIVLGLIKKTDKFTKLSFAIFACTFLLYFVVFILRVIVEAKYKAAWSDYLETIVSTLVLPVGVFFAALFFFPPKQTA